MNLSSQIKYAQYDNDVNVELNVDNGCTWGLNKFYENLLGNYQIGQTWDKYALFSA